MEEFGSSNQPFSRLFLSDTLMGDAEADGLGQMEPPASSVETLIAEAPQRKRVRGTEEQDTVLSSDLFDALGSTLPGNPVPDFMEDSQQESGKWHTQMSEDEIVKFLAFFDQGRPNSSPAQHSVNFASMNFRDGTPATTTSRISDITDIANSLHVQMEHLRWDQQQMLVPPSPEVLQKLNQQQLNIVRMIEEAQAGLQQVIDSTLLSPPLLAQTDRLNCELFFLLTSVKLFREELTYMAQPSGPGKCFATLVIRKQPFPKPLKQNTKTSSSLEEPILVQLVTAPKCDCQPSSPVTCSMDYDEFTNTKTSFTIEGKQQKLDDSLQARFVEMRIKQGTRLKMARLKFSVNVKFVQLDGSMGKATLESNLSEPLIVMTNENQWESAEANLLRKALFPAPGRNPDEVVRVPWFRFANTIQRHYLKATRQDPANPTRALSRYDMDYLHRNQFNGQELVLEQDFEKFWIWFGKVMHKIRHQKPFIFLWLKGVVYGFITREDAERVLMDQPPGAFVVRFSDRVAGKVAITYKTVAGGEVFIKHFLLNPVKELVTLPDFVQQRETFTHLLKLRTDFACEIGRAHV